MPCVDRFSTIAILLAAACVLLGPWGGPAEAQVPAGFVAGVATDASGSPLAGAEIHVANRENGLARQTTTSERGEYFVPLLPPGVYDVTADAPGFKRLTRAAVVEAATTTVVDLTLTVWDVQESVTVRAVLPQIRYDHHQVDGVVSRDQILGLPLNGRNFLELARLEPGVTNPIVQAATNRTFVPVHGAGLQLVPRVGYTRISVDGGSVNGVLAIGGGLSVSPETVQEFQTSTAGFDMATGPTTTSAINIVTRSGTNTWHGAGFAFYRDRTLSAHPDLRRDPGNPDPFFRRHQTGATLGGPIRKDRAFFFTSYERNDQRGALSVRPLDPDVARLGGVFRSPYLGYLLSLRVDGALTPGHLGFVRYTHDRNRSFDGANAPQLSLPSGWPHSLARAGQGIAALTSVLSPSAVNDVRVSSFAVDLSTRPPTAAECPGCSGLGMPRVIVEGAGLIFGEGRRLDFVGHRLQLTDTVVWQTGSHQIRAGVDWEHATLTSSALLPPEIRLWAPSQVRARAPAIVLPSTFATVDDVLALPLRGFAMTLGSTTTVERDFRPARVADLVRVHVSDTWRVRDGLTVNAGIGWAYEPNALNHDLTKPPLLSPILGARLDPPRVQRANFAPAAGFAWSPGRSGRTVVRGGAGRYLDPAHSANTSNLANERQLLSPLGTGQFTVTGSNILWNGRPLDFPSPTAFSGQHLLSVLSELRDHLGGRLDPDNRDFSIRNIDLSKEGANLSDPGNRTPSAIHLTLGVQREVTRGVVVSGDVVWKRFLHTHINGIDYNRFHSAAGPVIRRCLPEERDEVGVVCSNGPLMFDTTIGRARYRGLLLRADARIASGTRILASYALGSYVGTNGTGLGTAEGTGGRVFGFNNEDPFENVGPLPTDRRHVLNVSGIVELPWQVQVAVNVAAYSPPPFSAYVAGMDFNGDGTQNDLLPGTRVNGFGRGLDRTDLERLVASYNEQQAGRPTPGGTLAPVVALPAEYGFDDSYVTQDVRVTRTVRLGRGRVRLALFAEVFNLFNTANLVGFDGNLANRTFGQPRGRSTHIFGSGGPRAAQLGARLSLD